MPLRNLKSEHGPSLVFCRLRVFLAAVPAGGNYYFEVIKTIRYGQICYAALSDATDSDDAATQ